MTTEEQRDRVTLAWRAAALAWQSVHDYDYNPQQWRAAIAEARSKHAAALAEEWIVWGDE